MKSRFNEAQIIRILREAELQEVEAEDGAP